MVDRLSLKVAALVVLQGLMVMLTASAVQNASSPAREAPPSDGPNILFILTDDLDSRSPGRMPKLERWLAEQGTTFEEAFATTTACCPSRASILTGKYAHNHTVYTNVASDGTGGAPKFRSSGEERSTVATSLNDRGYETILIGKYLNHYDGTYVPPGWDEWRGQLDPKKDHRYNINGTVRYFDPDEYHDTDLFGDWAANYIREGAGKESPFFMYLSLNAPHGPDDGAPRDEDAYEGASLPRSPGFDEGDLGDKPEWVREQPRLGDADVEELAGRHRDRLRSLLSVDDMVARLLTELRATGELQNTYVVFTSDHGYHLGEHGLDHGKGTAYEEDIRVPLYVRGPGVPADRTLGHKVLNLDFAPTFAELGGAPVPDGADGRSFVPLLDDAPPPADEWRESFLVEYYQNHPYSALRTGRHTYVEYETGERELYDLETDPHQLESLHASPERQALMSELHARLEALKGCAGESCRVAEDAR